MDVNRSSFSSNIVGNGTGSTKTINTAGQGVPNHIMDRL